LGGLYVLFTIIYCIQALLYQRGTNYETKTKNSLKQSLVRNFYFRKE